MSNQPYSKPHSSEVQSSTEFVPTHSRQQVSRLLLLVCLGILTFAVYRGWNWFSLGGAIEETVEMRNQYTANHVTLATNAGNVQLIRGGDGQVVIEAIYHGFGSTSEQAKQRAAAVEPKITQDGDTVRIDDTQSRGFSLFGRSVYADYRITLPATANIKIDSGSGDISGSELQGPLNLSTSSGNIKLKQISGSVEARTAAGEITIEDSQIQQADLKTESGNLSVAGVNGVVKANATGGSLNVTGAQQSTIDLYTSNGDITFEGSLGTEKDHRAKSESGNIIFKLPPDTNVKVDARTGAGNISSDWNLQSDEGRQSGQIGTGGSTLNLDTSNGNITLALQ
jgi:hypothetical protein